jgi:hypothetical protein
MTIHETRVAEAVAGGALARYRRGQLRRLDDGFAP